LIVGYAAAIAAVLVTSIIVGGNLLAPPQPRVSVVYNSITGDSVGYINNTLSYSIIVYGFYCILNGQRYEFSDPGGQAVASGARAAVYFYGNSTSVNTVVPAYTNCMKWNIVYNTSKVAQNGGAGV